MNWKWLTYCLLFVLTFSLPSNLLSQNVELTTQAEVNAFAGTKKVVGFLLIRGNDITDLSPLNSLDTVTHSIFIEYNRSLKVLNGFDSLLYNGGTLLIENNPELDSIGTFGMLKMVKGPLVLRHNPVLRECCALYDLINGTQGVIKGGNLISGNKGCNSEKELRENCDADTDNDGVEDADDACPLDPKKINPGICGCGVSDIDSDNDGTPDCKDECPNDKNKILARDCGCGKSETDSDGDGVADCADECPSNPAITKVGICGCSNPSITAITVANVGTCNDNGTPSSSDDTYPVDVTITFEGAPTSGTLLLTGGTNYSTTFSGSSTAKSYTFFSVPFRSNGALIEIIATWEGNERCTRRNVIGQFGPESCSSGACNPPSNSTVDTENYQNAALISWTNLGAGTTYEVEYRPTGTTNWAIATTATNELLVNGLADYTSYDYRIRSFCDGQKYSTYLTGQFTSGGNECKLIQAVVQNINCNDNQTSDDTSDDYFTFDLYVEGTNVGNNFTISNGVGESTGQYNVVNSFRTANGTLGNGDVTINITDATDTNCQISAIVTDPGVCSNDCQINYITIGEVIKCFDRGSRWNTNDDFFTADLTVYFTNAPAAGELKVTGITTGRIVSTENLQDKNSYTFKGARIPAGGKDFTIKAAFTNGIDCIYNANFDGVLITKDKICQEQCNILNAQVSNVQCVEGENYLTFELVVNGINTASSYQVANVAGNSTGNYNQPAFFRTNSGINSQTIDLEITDSADPSCTYTIAINNPCVTQLKTNGINSGNALSQNNDLKVYPNPAKTTLFIDYRVNSAKATLEVFDVLGQKVISKMMREQSLDISQLTNGLYHLVVREGNNLQTKKFIKE